jgi:hypothetical protein
MLNALSALGTVPVQSHRKYRPKIGEVGGTDASHAEKLAPPPISNWFQLAMRWRVIREKKRVTNG